jgi:hypothetical protein
VESASANLSRIAGSILKGQRPRGMGHPVAFISGSLASYRYRIDRNARLYVAR